MGRGWGIVRDRWGAIRDWDPLGNGWSHGHWSQEHWTSFIGGSVRGTIGRVLTADWGKTQRELTGEAGETDGGAELNSKGRGRSWRKLVAEAIEGADYNSWVDEGLMGDFPKIHALDDWTGMGDGGEGGLEPGLQKFSKWPVWRHFEEGRFS